MRKAAPSCSSAADGLSGMSDLSKEGIASPEPPRPRSRLLRSASGTPPRRLTPAPYLRVRRRQLRPQHGIGARRRGRSPPPCPCRAAQAPGRRAGTARRGAAGRRSPAGAALTVAGPRLAPRSSCGCCAPFLACFRGACSVASRDQQKARRALLAPRLSGLLSARDRGSRAGCGPLTQRRHRLACGPPLRARKYVIPE